MQINTRVLATAVLICGLAPLSSESLQAQETRWKTITSGSTITIAVDTSSIGVLTPISPGGNSRYVVWQRWVHSKPAVHEATKKKYISTLYKREIDCVEKRTRMLSYVIYAPNGEVIDSWRGSDDWEEMIPDTYGEVALTNTCEYLRSTNRL